VLVDIVLVEVVLVVVRSGVTVAAVSRPSRAHHRWARTVNET
jgi:hypothetical protein